MIIVARTIKNMSEWVFYDIRYAGHLKEKLAKVPKGRPIAVICNVGHLTGLDVSILLWAGYPVVYNFPGSITARVAAGFPVTTDEAFEH